MKKLITFFLSFTIMISACGFVQAEEKALQTENQSLEITTDSAGYEMNSMALKISILIISLWNLYNSYQLPEAASVGIIGGADGPTAIYISEGE